MRDIISDVLGALQLTGAVFVALDPAAPWTLEGPRTSTTFPQGMEDVEHVIECHVVTAGACWAGLPGEPALHLEAGDVIVFPQGDALALEAHDRKQSAQMISGFLGCATSARSPLLASLPRVMHVRGLHVGDAVLRQLLESAVLESSSPGVGSACVLSRLGELLFVEVVRKYLASAEPEAVRWFAGLRDPSVGKALHALHQRPAHPWTLESLAKEAGMSRSLLAGRFAELVGSPPMQYLAEWRIQLAASLLRAGKSSLAQVAERVGYGSEAALSRAFKRCIGIAPAHYRREKLAAAS